MESLARNLVPLARASYRILSRSGVDYCGCSLRLQAQHTNKEPAGVLSAVSRGKLCE